MAKQTNEARIGELEQGQQELSSKIDLATTKIDEVVGAVNALADSVTKLASRDAKHVPVAPNQYHEAAEQFLGGVTNAEFKEVEGSQIIEKTSVADLTRPADQEKLQQLAFMSERLTIHIAEVSDTNEAQVFEIAVNGEAWVFKRGEVRNGVPRYIVEGLARARPINYNAEEYRDEQNLTQIRYAPRKGLRYPFSLVNASPRDQSWLNHVLAQP